MLAFSVVELKARADTEQVSEIFAKINSEGVTLNQAGYTVGSATWKA